MTRINTTPGYMNYSCSFKVNIEQGLGSPLTVGVERLRDGREYLELSVGDVCALKVGLDDNDCAALAELFSRAAFYVFPKQTDSEREALNA